MLLSVLYCGAKVLLFPKGRWLRPTFVLQTHYLLLLLLNFPRCALLVQQRFEVLSAGAWAQILTERQHFHRSHRQVSLPRSDRRNRQRPLLARIGDSRAMTRSQMPARCLLEACQAVHLITPMRDLGNQSLRLFRLGTAVRRGHSSLASHSLPFHRHAHFVFSFCRQLRA